MKANITLPLQRILSHSNNSEKAKKVDAYKLDNGKIVPAKENSISEWSILPEIASLCALIYESNNESVRFPLFNYRDHLELVSNPIAKYENLDKLLKKQEYISIAKNWKRVPDIPQSPTPSGLVYAIGGLIIDVWQENTFKDQSNKYIVVFRGSDKQLNDWWTNARWLTRFIPFTWDQYRQVIEYIELVVKHISELSPKAKIIATGHSLGGGLAHLAGYCSPKISEVYAFNSSPVTAYYSVDRDIREDGEENLIIHRISETDEILSKSRKYINFLHQLIKINHKHKRFYVECNFNSDGGAVKQHNMKDLSVHLKHYFDFELSKTTNQS
ncbi:DUF6792 domain-containing protein [Acaryochloris marina]|uniref:DUF6792 domain-containing protein n=1 Tax=Acaryochloris marina TaxID=155978 RepID=UPI0021C3A8AB|nr:DUF6792 domain-containing protein [Acaryochloris marina]BDM83085.1 hypothetical protein AM10699_59460 [Acaryochloris marina MBIC10699]